MRKIAVDVDPLELGLDPDRVARIGDHFDEYVESGKLPGYAALVARGNEICYLRMYGRRDLESSDPIEDDTIYRIYSMTKPVTSVAAMMLYEEGRFELTDPVSSFLPEFERQEVFVGGSSVRPVLRPAALPLEIWHLLTHTAGLTYGFMYQHPVDAMYRAAGFEWGVPDGADLAECCRCWASLPLLFEPGTSWNYSHATDVLGRLIEVISGVGLDEFFLSRIFEPLGMEDTGFAAAPQQRERLATLYMPDAKTGRALPAGRLGHVPSKNPSVLSGGGGLISSLGDYYQFARMLLNEGELDGYRLLSPRTLRYMATNHLPGGADIETFGTPTPSEPEAGVGFGLGFSVVIDPVAMRSLGTKGTFAWGGAASTAFWVDPTEELIVIFMTQLLPSSTYPIRRHLRQLVYQALVA